MTMNDTKSGAVLTDAQRLELANRIGRADRKSMSGPEWLPEADAAVAYLISLGWLPPGQGRPVVVSEPQIDVAAVAIHRASEEGGTPWEEMSKGYRLQCKIEAHAALEAALSASAVEGNVQRPGTERGELELACSNEVLKAARSVCRWSGKMDLGELTDVVNAVLTSRRQRVTLAAREGAHSPNTAPSAPSRPLETGGVETGCWIVRPPGFDNLIDNTGYICISRDEAFAEAVNAGPGPGQELQPYRVVLVPDGPPMRAVVKLEPVEGGGE